MADTDLRQIILALSDMLDLVGVDEPGHGKRVAFMATECCNLLRFNEDQLDTVYHAALLHDCGVSSSDVHRKLISEFEWDRAEEHCKRGHDLLVKQEIFADLAPIILHHHTHWEDLQKSGIPPETALISNLIYLTDRVDSQKTWYWSIEPLTAREIICQTIEKNRKAIFAPELVDVFLKMSKSDFFWLNMTQPHLEQYHFDKARENKARTLDPSALHQIADMFSEIVDAKSNYTVEHSRGVARLARYMGDALGLPEDVCGKLEIAGLLHDMGKLKVPDDILEKPGPLTQEERAVMRSHSFESYQILKRIEGFDEISKWAAFHHETMSGEGYPFNLDSENLSLEARIVSVADVFQALLQNRPYRPSMDTDDIVVVMRDMADKNKLDEKLVNFVLSNKNNCLKVAKGLKTTSH